MSYSSVINMFIKKQFEGQKPCLAFDPRRLLKSLSLSYQSLSTHIRLQGPRYIHSTISIKIVF